MYFVNMQASVILIFLGFCARLQVYVCWHLITFVGYMVIK
ncbi:hypothetical protein CYJ65_03290 [Gardnerella vaginalis]|nr:hypothetical protein CYJ63_05930 [Gardnerella vaginalis]PKZ74286.1 hypothetical protein CYJ65_03290 [Gardnerella vaginalis]